MEEIYHITHLSNLSAILKRGKLVCDHSRLKLGLKNQEIGYEHIKERRRKRVVPKAAGGTLADYVPFYFCPRSVMLYAIWQQTTPFQGGQEEVLHLEVKLETAVSLKRPWTFTNMHADLQLADFYTDLADRNKLRWDIIDSNSWGGDERRPLKQAEFLIHKDVPWSAVARIGVQNAAVATRVEKALKSAKHKPAVTIQPLWYYP